MLGGTRAGPTGREGPDILHPVFAPEVKTREDLPAWLLAAMEQAETNAPQGKLPLCILHRAGDQFEDALVVVRMRTWREWYGEVPCDASS